MEIIPATQLNSECKNFVLYGPPRSSKTWSIGTLKGSVLVLSWDKPGSLSALQGKENIRVVPMYKAGKAEHVEWLTKAVEMNKDKGHPQFLVLDGGTSHSMDMNRQIRTETRKSDADKRISFRAGAKYATSPEDFMSRSAWTTYITWMVEDYDLAFGEFPGYTVLTCLTKAAEYEEVGSSKRLVKPEHPHIAAPTVVDYLVGNCHVLYYARKENVGDGGRKIISADVFTRFRPDTTVGIREPGDAYSTTVEDIEGPNLQSIIDKLKNLKQKREGENVK